MKGLSERELKQVIQKYKTGKYNCTTLAKEFGKSKSYITKYLHRKNIKVINDHRILNRKYTLDEKYFDKIDTEAKAYFLGLLYADGSNNEKRNIVSISLQENDKKILEIFNKHLKTDMPIKIYSLKHLGSHIKNVAKLDINNLNISKQLSKKGCWANKSLSLEWIPKNTVPKNLLNHFVRGYFDGDGCIHYITKKNNLVVSLISTRHFCLHLQKIIKKALNINCSVGKPNRSRNTITRQLQIGGNWQSTMFLRWLYSNATIFLERKYQIYNDFMQQSKNKQKYGDK